MGSNASGITAFFTRQHASPLVSFLTPLCSSDAAPDPEPEHQTVAEDVDVTELPRSRNGKRALQNMAIKQERQRVVKWMKVYINKDGTADSICAIAIRNFPAIFRQPNMNANLQKASRWWKVRGSILARMDSESSFNCVSHRQLGGRKRVFLKAEARRDVRAALDNIRTHVQFLPENSTHLTQPCDTFIVSKIKDAWTRMREQQKVQMFMENDWQGNGDSRTSGLPKNPGKTFFLQVGQHLFVS
ncbi:hypothetical protein R1sor_017541 [Riccia sorocarpa]|uniref:Uncharacterized protein n=1 Tax=Riccia sorocarpa TaxID=122646 RepID=A0ABD3I8X6_9MARC